MNLEIYFNKKRELYETILSLIENEAAEELNEKLENFKEIIENQQICKSKESFKRLLKMLLKIFKNQHRHSLFFINYLQIFQLLKESIKKSFSNDEIYLIFRSNKLILLFLHETKIINITDEEILSDLLKKSDKNNFPYRHYFYPEIKEFVDSETRLKIEHELFDNNPYILNGFFEKRKVGLNDSYISSLIREDSVDEFILYVNKRNISLDNEITPSLFETNQFLMAHNPTLIEYSAFYGSIEIFQFLRFNNVEFKPSIWLYTIHGRNPEIIHILEEYKIKPPDDTYYSCLEESVKCHHNEIANYFNDNFVEKEKESYYNNLESYCFHYLNFSLLPSKLNNEYLFCYMCQFDYFEVVKFLMSNNSANITYEII